MSSCVQDFLVMRSYSPFWCPFSSWSFCVAIKDFGQAGEAYGSLGRKKRVDTFPSQVQGGLRTFSRCMKLRRKVKAMMSAFPF